MNVKGRDPRELCVELLSRSICSVQVAAVLYDRKGILAWGYNHAGDGFGEHAEAMVLKRANRKRIPHAVLVLAARRRKSRNPVTARPCKKCIPLVSQCLIVAYRNKEGDWVWEDYL